jgi:transglutaminase-like putative cysteine protease
MREYLEVSRIIDWQTPQVLAVAKQLRQGQGSPQLIAQACFEFVRDEIRHSWDSQQNPVTLTASQVLQEGHGFCWAKSHLLAALLRANQLPAALCYQRLTITDQPPFCLHGLNAVFLPQIGWYRLDARGNKPGVQAQFHPPEEQLAFALVHPGERDIAGFFSKPLELIVQLLRRCTSVDEVASQLPQTDLDAL